MGGGEALTVRASMGGVDAACDESEERPEVVDGEVAQQIGGSRLQNARPIRRSSAMA